MWNLLRQAKIPLRVTSVLALLYLFYIFLDRHSGNKALEAERSRNDAAADTAFNDAYGGTDLKILQFYVRDGNLVEGKSTVICYGVVNAKSVKIDPPLGETGPSLSRCLDAAPKHDTTYTLTAEGNNGKVLSSSVAVHLVADTENLPRIVTFRIAKDLLEKGRHIYTLSFTFENGKTVSIDPPVFSPIEDSAPFGQFYVSPDHTTTYTLTVSGAHGHKAEKKLTIEK